MTVGGMGLVTLFDFTRYPPTGFQGFHDDHRDHRIEGDVSYDVGIMPRHASFAAGRLIVRPTTTVEALKDDRQRARDPRTQQYATFKILDWKNDQEVEVSCSPDSLSSYFEPNSPLPLQISPAFLDRRCCKRFKADHDKYTLTDRTIACRGAWSLKGPMTSTMLGRFTPISATSATSLTASSYTGNRSTSRRKGPFPRAPSKRISEEIIPVSMTHSPV